MKVDMLIKNGNVVFPACGVRRADIAVKDGKIAGIFNSEAEIEVTKIIDASNLYVFPGVIDPHMHIGIYNELEYDFTEQTKSAALGGITSIINYYRGKDSYHNYAPHLIETGEKNSCIDFTFSFGLLTDRHLQELQSVTEAFGITSYKFYRNYQDNIGKIFQVEDPLNLDSADLMDILVKFKMLSPKMLLCVHCEDMDIQRSTVKQLKAGKREDDLAFYSKISPDYVETNSILQLMYINKHVGGSAYTVHVSSASSIEAIEKMEDWLGEGIIFETCPHYLTLNENSPCGLLGIVNPPIHKRSDSDKLWEAISKGYIKTIGSDNCPNDIAKKYSKGNTVWDTTPGFGGAGMILPILLSEGYHKRGIALETLANVSSYEVAKVFNMPKKGKIAVGCDADFAIVDLEKEITIRNDSMPGCDYSVYEGMKIKGWPVYTISRGAILQKDGIVSDCKGHGRFIKREL